MVGCHLIRPSFASMSTPTSIRGIRSGPLRSTWARARRRWGAWVPPLVHGGTGGLALTIPRSVGGSRCCAGKICTRRCRSSPGSAITTRRLKWSGRGLPTTGASNSAVRCSISPTAATACRDIFPRQSTARKSGKLFWERNILLSAGSVRANLPGIDRLSLRRQGRSCALGLGQVFPMRCARRSGARRSPDRRSQLRFAKSFDS